MPYVHNTPKFGILYIVVKSQIDKNSYKNLELRALYSIQNFYKEGKLSHG